MECPHCRENFDLIQYKEYGTCSECGLDISDDMNIANYVLRHEKKRSNKYSRQDIGSATDNNKQPPVKNEKQKSEVPEKFPAAAGTMDTKNKLICEEENEKAEVTGDKELRSMSFESIKRKKDSLTHKSEDMDSTEEKSTHCSPALSRPETKETGEVSKMQTIRIHPSECNIPKQNKDVIEDSQSITNILKKAVKDNVSNMLSDKFPVISKVLEFRQALKENPLQDSIKPETAVKTDEAQALMKTSTANAKKKVKEKFEENTKFRSNTDGYYDDVIIEEYPQADKFPLNAFLEVTVIIALLWALASFLIYYV